MNEEDKSYGVYVKFTDPCTQYGCLKLRRFHSSEALEIKDRPTFFLKYYVADAICEENNFDYKKLLVDEPEMISESSERSLTISLLLPNLKEIEPCYTRTLFFLPY